jgi:beta-galactosidase
VKNGNNILATDGSPKLHLFRATHQTDDWWVDREWVKYGVNNLTYTLIDIKAETIDNVTARVVATIKAEGKEGFEAVHTSSYTIKGDGSVKVDNKIQFAGMRINLARIGVRMLLDKKYDRLNYFGRGPIENYVDRKSAQDVGIYELEVNNQYEYEKPMEHGNREEIRWVKFNGENLTSFEIKADEKLMQFSALPHTDEQMNPVEYKIDLPKSTSTVFCLSTKTLGVGSASCGPRPLEKYQVKSDDTEFSYTIRF